MVQFAAAVLAGLSLSSVGDAYQISVKATGGNATSPIQYGIMHEVGEVHAPKHRTRLTPRASRISTTRVMGASTPS